MKKTDKKIVICCLVVIFTYSVAFLSNAEKKRVAVLDFDYQTIQNRWWGNEWDLGKEISDIVVKELVQDGTFSVMERKQLESIMAEQKLAISGLVEPSSAAEIGRILGVQAVLLGNITQLNLKSDRILDLGGIIKKRKVTAIVQINARLVDTSTSEIIAAGEGIGEVSQTTMKVDLISLEFGSDNFEKALLREAIHQAVRQLLNQLTNKTGLEKESLKQ